MSKVSIIVPVYNQEKYLRECLESIARQDLEDYEALLIDDGSTDDSKAICEEFSAQNNAFRYIYQENAGPGPARNTGLSLATGTYVVFVDPDDVLEKKCLGKAIQYMEERCLDILYMDMYFCNETLQDRRIWPILPEVKTQISRIEALESFSTRAYVWAKIYRIELFSDIRLHNIWYEDIACTPALICAAERIGYYKLPLYFYRQHTESITQKSGDIRSLDIIKAWDIANQTAHASADEKVAIRKSLAKSVAAFLMSKSANLYIENYLEWYRLHLEGRIWKYAVETKENAALTDDYPLMQQAVFFGLYSTVDWLRELRRLYEKGGEYYAIPIMETKFEEDEVLFLEKTDTLEICGIRAKAQSLLLWDINQKLRGENIISLKGNLKHSLLKKILIEAFIQHGYPVRLVSGRRKT